MSTIKVNTLEEATVGGATFYTAKAWVNFNGSGTVAIRDSGNVSSITDTNTGRYVVNFNNSLSSTSYAPTMGFGTTLNYDVGEMLGNYGFTPAFLSSSCRFMAGVSSSYYDGQYCMLSAVE